MSKSFLRIFTRSAFVLLIVTSPLFAETNGAKDIGKNLDLLLDQIAGPVPLGNEWQLKGGGESRYRFELRDDFNLNDGAYEDDALNLLRNRYSLDLKRKQTEGLSVDFFAEGQDAHSFAQSEVNKTNTFVNELDLRQLSAEFGHPVKGIPLNIKVGRQELSYGDERFVGPSNWTNTGRVFDAVKLFFPPDGWFRFDMFFARGVRNEKEKPDESVHADNFYGIYGTLTKLQDHVLDAFLFIRHNRDRGTAGEKSGGFGQLKEYTFGNRFKGKKFGFDYGTEYALQFGSRAHDSIEAWAIHQEIGYTFSKTFWTPRLFSEFNHASGDRNPTDGVYSTFDNLFPSNHDKYGVMDFFSLKNMNEIRGGINLKPCAKLSLTSDFHWFFLDAKESAWFNASGGVFRAANPSADTQLGEEIDLLGVYKLTQHLNLLMGYSHFFAGPFAKDTGTHDDANFFYSQIALKV